MRNKIPSAKVSKFKWVNAPLLNMDPEYNNFILHKDTSLIRTLSEEVISLFQGLLNTHGSLS